MKRWTQFSLIKFFVLTAILCTCLSEVRLYAVSPSVVMDVQGNGIAIWHDVDTMSNLRCIYANTFSSNAWGTPEIISDTASHSQKPVISISNTTGNAVAIWFSISPDGTNHLIAAQFSFSSSSWSSPEIISQPPGCMINAWSDYHVAISEAPNNPMLAIWSASGPGGFLNCTANAVMGGSWSTSP